MADKYVVPPVDDSEESLRIFYEQICEQLNGSAGVLDSTGLSGVNGGEIPQVTGFNATGGYGSVYLSWNPVDYDSHSETVFFRSEDGQYDNAISVGSTAADSFTDTFHDPSAVKTYTYWAANRNIGGELGPISAPATTQLAVDAEYAIDVLLGKLGYDEFKDGNFPVRTEETLPLLPDGDYPEGSVIFLLTNGKLYRNVNQAWTKDLDLGDIDGAGILAGKDNIALSYVTDAGLLAGLDNILLSYVTDAGSLAGLDNITLSYVTDAGLLAGLNDITLSYVTDAGSLAGLSSISSTNIDDGAITTPKIFSGAVITDKLATNSVVADKIASSAITVNKLAANSVVADKIASGAITADKIAANSVIAGKIAAGALVVDDGVMQNGYIKTALIDDLAVTAAKITDLTITNAKIADGTIDKAKIASLDADDIVAGTITGITIQTSSTVNDGVSADQSGIKMIGDTLTVYDTGGNVRVKLGEL